MATYKEIKGTTVKVRSSSMPTTYPQVAGELYYNSSNGKYEFLSSAVGAWSSGGNLGTARQGITGAGIQTAGLVAGGEGAPPGGISQGAKAEEYDGSSWSEQNDMNTAKTTASALGIQTDALVAGGISPAGTFALTEKYNGTSWTEVNDMNTACLLYTSPSPRD